MALLELSFPDSPDLDLSVRRFDLSEGLSELFEVTVVAVSPDGDLDLEQMVGKAARLAIERGALGKRVFSGVCSLVEQRGGDVGGASGDLVHYHVRIVPRAFLLTQRRGQRIFQHASTPEIVRTLLAEWQIEPVMRIDERAFPKHEYRVQYAESDWAFVSRLLEDAGVSYFFEEPQSQLVLADGPERAEARGPLPIVGRPSEGSRAPYLTSVHVAGAVLSGALAIGDFDFRRPRYRPIYRAASPGPGEAALEQYAYAPGASILDVDAALADATDTPAADDHSRARADDGEGQSLARRSLDGLRIRRRTLSFATNLVDLGPGTVVTVASGARRELGPDARLVVTGGTMSGSPGGEWTVTGTAVLGGAPVKPPRRTARPRVEGMQSAVVVGPPGDEIYTDESGRVRLRFHWDREGEYDDNRTSWVRVSQGVAGVGFGLFALPRVGQEVLVSFQEGNPDQPLVVGRVYDASSPPPDALPGSAARAAWRTRSSPGSDGHSEIAFDDRTGMETVTVRSERDLEKVVEREERETVGLDRTFVVGRHHSGTIGSEDTTVAGRVSSVTMAKMGDLRIGRSGDPESSPLETRREIVAKRITVSTGGAMIVLDGPEITVSAERDIRIQAGGTVVIQGGPLVHINPPILARAGDRAEPPPPPDRVVFFELVSDGRPLAGARCYLEHADGTCSAALVADGQGRVQLPVDKPGPYEVRLGRPPAQPPSGEPGEGVSA